MNTTYSTLEDAVYSEIVDPIMNSGEIKDAFEEFDVDTIAEQVLGDYDQGYALTVDEEYFWKVVALNARH